MPEQPCPILVLGSGQRCGSTLVQRLLTSHPDILVWGEHGGHLRDVMRASSTIERWDEWLSGPARAAFSRSGHHGWLANLLPEPDHVAAAARAYVRTLFAEPAVAAGCSRWGLKEVRFGFEEAQALRDLFPATAVVHVTRDPRDVLRSLDWWEREGPRWTREYTEAAMAYWVSVNESFLGTARGAPWIESWRYEDLVADHDGFIRAMSRLFAVSADDLDRSVLERRVFGYQEPAARERPQERLRALFELPADLRALLNDERLRSTAAAYGYSLDGAVP